ncbi:DUF5110 domain-containing protein [Oxalobacteraceae bacterium]|nr:DUF5110 domain-containing protein [Oxalobacteraceae bacterium]
MKSIVRFGLRVVPLLLLAPAAWGQGGVRTLEDYAQRDGYLELRTSDGLYRIAPYSGKIVETSFIPKGEQFDPASHAVVLKPNAPRATLKAGAAGLEYAAGGMVVTIQRSPFRISYAYQGRQLVAEKHGYSKGKDAEGKDSEAIDFELDASEAIYGAGARAVGMDRRGNRLKLYNKAHYGYEQRSELVAYAMPLVLSSKLYALHFDNAQSGYLDIDSKHDKVLAFETMGGRKTYQVIAGDSWADLVGSYSALTGRQPLLPRWALGNISSRFGYHSEEEARALVDQYHKDQIPLDGIIFDIYWYGVDMKGRVGNLEFVKEKFPDARKMMADFSAKGVKTIVSIEPYIMTTSNRWKEALDRDVLAKDAAGKPFVYDVYFGNTALLDIFSKPGKDWFWEKYKDLHEQGIAGCFCDLGEPEGHPAGLLHVNGTADQVHNIYGHEWARMMADGYRRELPKERPFLLMRAGYSGSQRFGLIPSSGDSNRTWGGLQSQAEIALQMGMQGVAYMHSDLGGFAGTNLDDELYVRWMQYGTFQPIFRPHGQEEVPSEPVYRAEPAKSLARDAIRLRYALLPYNYTLAFENNQTGLPLMRPLLFEEPGNAAVRTQADSYLWGDAILVTPVVQPGLREKSIYFPARSAWFDYYSGEKHAGGSTASIALKAEHLPLFVRAGSFLPMAPPMQSTQNYSGKHLDLHYYHDASVSAATGQLYDDDGKTPDAYEKGEYQLTAFSSKFAGASLAIALDARSGKQARLLSRSYSLVVHNVAAQPAAVKLDGRSVASSWDAQRKQLTVALAASSKARRQVTVQLARAANAI